MSFICPNCGLPLAQEPNSKNLRCENNHSFDCARQGYYNLLLANQKASKEPGDTSEMLQARNRFLETGKYSFLVRAIGDVMSEYLARAELENTAFTLFDCGCGEGYYTRELQKRYCSLPSEYYCIDIAKNGVKMAASQARLAKQNIEIHTDANTTLLSTNFAVASSANLPVAGNIFDVFLSVFAPFNETEVARILKPGGIFIRVAPGPSHLFELKQQLYTTPQKHTAPDVPVGFKMLSEQCIANQVMFDNEAQFSDLLYMTPFAYKGMREAKQTLYLSNNNQITAEFFVQVLACE